MVRSGEYTDVPIIMELISEAHEFSKYKDLTIDKDVLKLLILGAIQRMNVKGEGGTCVYVYDDDGVHGFIIGVTERIYHVAKEFRASDIFFYVTESYNDPLAFRMLLKSFEEWAWSNKRVKKIDIGITDIIGEPRRLAAVLSRFGYNECGLMVEKYRPEVF